MMSAPHFIALGEKALFQGHSIRVKAGGSSMYPLLRENDRLTIEPITTENILKGDILVYKDQSRLIAHRFLKFNQDRIITRGDFSFQADKPFSSEELLGRVVHVERKGKAMNPKSLKWKIMSMISGMLPAYFLLWVKRMS